MKPSEKIAMQSAASRAANGKFAAKTSTAPAPALELGKDAGARVEALQTALVLWVCAPAHYAPANERHHTIGLTAQQARQRNEAPFVSASFYTVRRVALLQDEFSEILRLIACDTGRKRLTQPSLAVFDLAAKALVDELQKQDAEEPF